MRKELIFFSGGLESICNEKKIPKSNLSFGDERKNERKKEKEKKNVFLMTKSIFCKKKRIFLLSFFFCFFRS